LDHSLLLMLPLLLKKTNKSMAFVERPQTKAFLSHLNE
jgi:hypothetical protein